MLYAFSELWIKCRQIEQCIRMVSPLISNSKDPLNFGVEIGLSWLRSSWSSRRMLGHLQIYCDRFLMYLLQFITHIIITHSALHDSGNWNMFHVLRIYQLLGGEWLPSTFLPSLLGRLCLFGIPEGPKAALDYTGDEKSSPEANFSNRTLYCYSQKGAHMTSYVHAVF
jgi:hypothetical protein